LLRIDGAFMSEAKPRLVGLNHIALEVGDVDEALSFYGQIFSFELRGRSKGQAFIDMGDQFIALNRRILTSTDASVLLWMSALVFVTSSAPPAPFCSKVIFLISPIRG
jgi:catechol 2,3-dioxygenase-like lactoylglutathione lyase family enzyme